MKKHKKLTKLPPSVRKYIRAQKALIRKSESDLDKQKELIKNLYQKFISKDQLQAN